MSFSGHLSVQRVFASLLVTATLALIGCGLGVTATGSTDTGETAMMFGTVKGGNVPISGASIQLWEAGTAGYGITPGTTGGAILRATYASDAGTGHYTFSKGSGTTGTNNGSDNTWHCPTDGSDPLIYLLGLGGDPTGGTTNNFTEIVLAAMIGPCSTINSGTQVNLSELSTIGFAASFGQYMNPGTSTPGQEGISTNGAYVSAAPSTHQSALAAYNAWLNYSNNLIYVPTGGVYAPRTYSGTAPSVVNVQVTVTPEAGKMIAAANALSSCVNSDPGTSTNCAQLFDAAAPPVLASATAYGGTFPTVAVDTLQAALFMTSLNPGGVNTTAGGNTVSTSGACSTADGPATTNPGCIYGLIGKNSAFTAPAGVTALAGLPSDWSIGITYTAGGGTDVTGPPTAITLPSSNTCSGGTGGAASGPFLFNTFKGAVDASGNIWFIGGDNNISSNASNLAEMSPIGQPLLCLGGKATGSGLTIDPSGNVWGAWANLNANGLGEVVAGGSTINFKTSLNHPNGVASDFSGNIIYSSTQTDGFVYKLPAGSNTSTTLVSVVDSSPSSGFALNYVAIDPNGEAWIGSRTGSNYHIQQGPGTTFSISKWSAAAPVSSVAVYTFTGPNSTNFQAGDTITLSGFTSQKAGVGTQPSPAFPLLNGTFTVKSAGASTITVSITTSQTALISSVTSDTGAKASIPTGTYNSIANSLTSNSYGSAVDSAGFIYTGTTCCGTSTPFRFLTKLTPIASNGTSTRTDSATNLAGTTGVRYVALDGADNAWISNEYSAIGDATATSFYPVTAIATAGSGTTATFTALTPTGTAMTTTTCNTSGSGCPTNGGIEKSDVQYALDLELDSSGNVWVFNNTVATASSTASAGTIVEIVGVAVPVITPLSAGIGTSTANSKLATKP